MGVRVLFTGFKNLCSLPRYGTSKLAWFSENSGNFCKYRGKSMKIGPKLSFNYIGASPVHPVLTNPGTIVAFWMGNKNNDCLFSLVEYLSVFAKPSFHTVYSALCKPCMPPLSLARRGGLARIKLPHIDLSGDVRVCVSV